MKTVEEFYNVQWGSRETISEYNLFLIIFDTALQKSYQLLGDLRRKKILEIGFGSGQQAFHFASLGAKVTAIDISRQSFKALQNEIKNKKIKNFTLKLMNAENITFANQTFDAIYINSVLMHVNKSKVFQHCARVLKTGGRLVMAEPLKGNPFIALVRRFSKYHRMNPQYMSLKEFKRYQSYFSSFQHQEFYLLSWCLFPLYKLFNIQKQFFFQKIMEEIEQMLISVFPFLRSWCWVSVWMYKK